MTGASAALMEVVSPRIVRYESYNEWRNVCGMTHLLQLHVDVAVPGQNLSPVGKLLLTNGDKR